MQHSEELELAVSNAVGLLWETNHVFLSVVDKYFPAMSARLLPSPAEDEKHPGARAGAGASGSSSDESMLRLEPSERKRYLARCKAIREKLQSGKGQIPRQERVELIRQYQKMKQMIRDSSAIQIQAAWRGYQIRKPVLSAQDPSHRRLLLAQETIKKQREAYNRPQKVSMMTAFQLQEDKAFLKRLLNGLDRAFKHKNGRLPTKQEKEVYRPIYEEYRSIKDMLNAASTQMNNNPESIAQMKAEKRALQIQLNKFEREFRK